MANAPVFAYVDTTTTHKYFTHAACISYHSRKNTISHPLNRTTIHPIYNVAKFMANLKRGRRVSIHPLKSRRKHETAGLRCENRNDLTEFTAVLLCKL